MSNKNPNLCNMGRPKGDPANTRGIRFDNTDWDDIIILAELRFRESPSDLIRATMKQMLKDCRVEIDAVKNKTIFE